MKKSLILVIFLLVSVISYSNHLKGGWIYYETLGPGTAAGTIKYRITIKQYLDCASTPQQVDVQVYLGIFSNATNQLVDKETIPKSNSDTIKKTTFNPCISDPPPICYRIDSYVVIVDLPELPAGYTLAVQRCCRIAGIINVSGSSQIGVSYTTSIPGTSVGVNATHNNSPVFAQKDTAVVCYNGNFTFDFGAVDEDGDSLTYAFCNGLTGGGSATSGSNSAQPNPPSNPPYSSVPYSGVYTGSSPMGSLVNINPATGLISGIAPSQIGDYVVAVCATEWRNGVRIGETKKEIHITVANCSLAAADLKPTYLTCDGFTLNFQNESTSPLVSSYTWQFGDPRSGAGNISTAPTPTHTYTDTGVYVLKLNVESSGGCKDSTTSLVRVFPGFVPDFVVSGSCFEKPFTFTDKTITKYGVVDSWKWNFGDTSTTGNTSTIQNTTYQYGGAGKRQVSLAVTNSKGCAATLTKEVNVIGIPVINLPFRDTLICSIDTLQLSASGIGTIAWKTNPTLINPNSPNPLVFPKDTTTYYVSLNDNGCINNDSVKVNVLNFITVNVSNDTSICRTDSVLIKTNSQALQYIWNPATGLNNPTNKNPVASPATTTKYYVTAKLGKCQDKDSIIIKVAPYPQANAGSDVSICYGTRIPLSASVVGAFFTWTPTSSLLNPNTLNPIAGPTSTTAYVLSSYDTVGCPKPFRDTVVVMVIPKVIANAGNDTSIVANQALQLNATGGSAYAWSPATGLSNTNISNPVAILNDNTGTITYVVRVSTNEGCFADDDIKVTVFKTGPEIFVPSGFTPNADGKNDILKPIIVGMKGLTYFKIYNRSGQLLYSTSEVGQGWDGRFGGVAQQSGTYVFAAEALDYNGHKIVRKGTVVLIR